MPPPARPHGTQVHPLSCQTQQLAEHVLGVAAPPGTGAIPEEKEGDAEKEVVSKPHVLYAARAKTGIAVSVSEEIKARKGAEIT